jgi:hypothetical protein
MRPLILLFGLPRSGTSWVGKIFDSHPSTIYRHEPDSRGALNDVALLPAPSEIDCFLPAARRFVGNLPHIGWRQSRCQRARFPQGIPVRAAVLGQAR